jgi:hypothetical protein
VKLAIEYDLGNEKQTLVVGVRAQVGWELRTKRKISDIANGLAITDIVGLLYEQLKVDDNLPVGAVNDLTLAGLLHDINPVEVPSDPTAADQSSAP